VASDEVVVLRSYVWRPSQGAANTVWKVMKRPASVFILRPRQGMGCDVATSVVGEATP
jgi:hypothetical protein